MGVAIICACLPIYRPLVTKAVELSSKVRDEYGSLLLLRTFHRNKSSRLSNSLGRDSSTNNTGTYNNLVHPNEDVIHLTKVTGASYRDNYEFLSRDPKVGTTDVQRPVEVV